MMYVLKSSPIFLQQNEIDIVMMLKYIVNPFANHLTAEQILWQASNSLNFNQPEWLPSF